MRAQGPARGEAGGMESDRSHESGRAAAGGEFSLPYFFTMLPQFCHSPMGYGATGANPAPGLTMEP